MPNLSEQLSGFRFRLSRAEMNPEKVRTASERICQRWPDIDDEEIEMEPKILIAEMRRRIKRNNWDDFYWSDAIRTARAFFDDKKFYQGESFQDVRQFLICQISHQGNAVYNSVMFTIYLNTFDPNSELTKILAEKIKELKPWDSVRHPIRRLNEKFNIFNVKIAPKKIEGFMHLWDRPYSALHHIGLKSPHGLGLMQYVHQGFVHRMNNKISRGDAATIEKLLNWLHPPDIKPLEQGAELGIDALLEPWHLRAPDEKIRKLIQKKLLEAYKHPRVRRAGVWERCSKKSVGVISRWLVGDTIEIFFNIISHTADEHHDHQRMWKNRRDVWIELYKENRITEAWFALSRWAKSIAREIEEDSGRGIIYYANNNSNGDDRHKCILIMKVNERWVVEGSYNFATRVFPQNVQIESYRESYTLQEFRDMNEPHEIRHSKGWANRVLQVLER